MTGPRISEPTPHDRVWSPVIGLLLAGRDQLTVGGVLATGDLQPERRKTFRGTLGG